MKFLLRSLILLICLLFGRISFAQEAQFTTVYDTIRDTSADHFEDYWRRANDALLTPSGRSDLVLGRVRLSLRAMSNPARYGLVSQNDTPWVVTAAEMLCENRESGSLQLRCRMPGEPHGRRVRLTEAQCRGAPDLYTLVPEGCQHPYVMTVEDREVRLSRVALAVAPPPPEPPAPPAEPQPVVDANPLPNPDVARLQRELSAEREAVREHRAEAHALSKQLSRAYIGLFLLTLCIAAASLIAWRARGRAETNAQYVSALAGQVTELQINIAKAAGPTDGSGAYRIDPVIAHGVARLGNAFVAVRDAFHTQRQEKDLLIAENARLRAQLDADPPSIVVDAEELRLAEAEMRVRAETEAAARDEIARLRRLQDVEREKQQNTIDELRRQLELANARRSVASELRPSQAPHPSESEASTEVPFADIITDVIAKEVGQDRRRGPPAAMTSARSTHVGIGEPPGSPTHHGTLRPPAPADDPSSSPALTGSPPPSSPSTGDDHRTAENDPWDPEPPTPSSGHGAAHPLLEHNDTSVSRPAIMPPGRVGIPLEGGGYIAIEDAQNS